MVSRLLLAALMLWGAWACGARAGQCAQFDADCNLVADPGDCSASTRSSRMLWTSRDCPKWRYEQFGVPYARDAEIYATAILPPLRPQLLRRTQMTEKTKDRIEFIKECADAAVAIVFVIILFVGVYWLSH